MVFFWWVLDIGYGFVHHCLPSTHQRSAGHPNAGPSKPHVVREAVQLEAVPDKLREAFMSLAARHQRSPLSTSPLMTAPPDGEAAGQEQQPNKRSMSCYLIGISYSNLALMVEHDGSSLVNES